MMMMMTTAISFSGYDIICWKHFDKILVKQIGVLYISCALYLE